MDPLLAASEGENKVSGAKKPSGKQVKASPQLRNSPQQQQLQQQQQQQQHLQLLSPPNVVHETNGDSGNNNNNVINGNGMENRNPVEYLAELLLEHGRLQTINTFLNPNTPNQPAPLKIAERLINEEIVRVRGCLFPLKHEELVLPEEKGQVVTLSEKLWVPVEKFPEFNFVGRILGPRGMTAKQLEQETGCKIMVRGSGSMRDKKKEEQNRGKPNWEHLKEPLHVLITVEDTEKRARMKMDRAREEIQKLLVPSPEGEDVLKKMQLEALAILNGTYRYEKLSPTVQQVPTFPRIMTSAIPPPMRTPIIHTGTPIILAPRMPQNSSPNSLNSSSPEVMNGGHSLPHLISPSDHHPVPPNFIYAATPFDVGIPVHPNAFIAYAPNLEASSNACFVR